MSVLNLSDYLLVVNGGNKIDLLSSPEKVGQLTINYLLLGQNVPIPTQMVKELSEWVYDLCQRSTEPYICFNNVLVLKEDMNKVTL